jgi:hypothetical protein
MNEPVGRLSGAATVWVFGFLFLLVFISSVWIVGGFLVDHPIVILISVVIATILGILELVTT